MDEVAENGFGFWSVRFGCRNGLFYTGKLVINGLTGVTTAFFGGSGFSLIISDFSSVGAGFSVGFANKLGVLDALSGVKREVG